jgi:hypothetical protein
MSGTDLLSIGRAQFEAHREQRLAKLIEFAIEWSIEMTEPPDDGLTFPIERLVDIFFFG